MERITFLEHKLNSINRNLERISMWFMPCLLFQPKEWVHVEYTILCRLYFVSSIQLLICLQKLKGSPKQTKSKKPLLQPSLSSTTSDLKLSSFSSSSSSSNKKKDPLLPRYAWFALFIAYHARRFIKKRQEAYEEDDWFIKHIDARLEYYGVREYEDDFLSVDGSFYGSMSKRDGQQLSKFDLWLDLIRTTAQYLWKDVWQHFYLFRLTV